LLRPFEGAVGWDAQYQFEFEAGRYDGREPPQANFEVTTPGYFQTVGTPLLEGRDFTEHDDEDAESVVIVSDSLATRLRNSGLNPIGQRLRLGRGPAQPGTKVAWMRVIGVCASARYRNLTQSGDDIFVPYLQASAPTNYIVLRGSRPAGELAALARMTLAEIDPNQAVADVVTLGDLIDRATARHRFNMMLLLWFAVCSVILSAIGIYSVITEGIVARKREIAIKIALGAGRPRLVREIVCRALVFVLAGEAVGLCCLGGFGRSGLGELGSELLYGVSPYAPMILGSVFIFLFTVSVAAAFFPAWLAAARDPNAELHQT
jgi:hypothetical protein